MPKPRTAASESAAPPRLRLKLRTVDDCAAELARLYRQARVGQVPTQDASRLANMLSILQRMIEGGELERRLQVLEEQTHAPIH